MPSQEVGQALRVARPGAILMLGSSLVLVLLLSLVKTHNTVEIDMLFAGCCDVSICSKYALENCKRTTGGGGDDGAVRSGPGWTSDDPGTRDTHLTSTSRTTSGQQLEINYPGALKAAKALGLTRDNRRADAKIMSQSLRSLMAKHSGKCNTTSQCEGRRRGGRRRGEGNWGRTRCSLA